jgi:hypothetical protein
MTTETEACAVEMIDAWQRHHTCVQPVGHEGAHGDWLNGYEYIWGEA